jgi:hypothetical protein
MLEQPFVHRPELSGGAADPVRQGRAIELDALASVDLALPIERQVVGILGDQDMGNQGFRGQPALDQPRRRGRLDHRALAGPAAIPGPAGDDHPELRRGHVEPFGDLLADPVHRAATAGTGLVAGLDDDLFARQMLGQSAAVATTLPDARRFERRVGPFLIRLALGQGLLEVLEGQLELIGMGRPLRAPPEQGPLQLFDDRPQVLVLPASLAAVARSARSRALSVATSSGSGAASAVSGEGLMGAVDHTAGVF